MGDTDTNLPPPERMPEVGTPEWKALCKENELPDRGNGGRRKGSGRPRLSKEVRDSRKETKALRATQKEVLSVRSRGKLKRSLKKIIDLTPDAIKVLEDIMKTGDDQDRRQAAEAILRRTMPDQKKDDSNDKPVMVVYVPQKQTSGDWKQQAQQVLQLREDNGTNSGTEK